MGLPQEAAAFPQRSSTQDVSKKPRRDVPTPCLSRHIYTVMQSAEANVIGGIASSLADRPSSHVPPSPSFANLPDSASAAPLQSARDLE